MRRSSVALLAILVVPHLASAQSGWAGAVSGGTAFMVDVDDRDPAGSLSTSFSVRRQGSGSFSWGLEAGYHRYLALTQDLPIGPSQPFASRLDDSRAAWRVTPMVRWQAKGRTVRPYGTLGAGLFLTRAHYLQQERDQDGVLMYDQRLNSTDLHAGLSLGGGIEIFPGRGRLGAGLGLRIHNAIGSGADGFLTAEIGIVRR